jgi:tetratricopeptide (TPR) repeat protein
MSLYQIGNIYHNQGKYEQAEKYLRSFVLEYPSVEFYSFALHSMLDAELKRGNIGKALTDYESLRPIYLDDPSGTLHKNFYDVYTRIYEAGGKTSDQMLLDLRGELDYFIDNYSDTYFYPDVLLLKGRLLYRYLDRSEGKKILNQLQEDYTQREDLLSEVESILSAR